MNYRHSKARSNKLWHNNNIALISFLLIYQAYGRMPPTPERVKTRNFRRSWNKKNMKKLIIFSRGEKDLSPTKLKKHDPLRRWRFWAQKTVLLCQTKLICLETVIGPNKDRKDVFGIFGVLVFRDCEKRQQVGDLSVCTSSLSFGNLILKSLYLLV